MGGYLAEKFGTRFLFGGQNFLAACLTVLTPFAAQADVWVVIALRFVMGVVEGVTYPALPPLINRWIPENERARFVSFTYLGGALGASFAFPLCGLLIEYVGWESVFYIIGSITVIWCIFWFLYVTNDPTTHKGISKAEKEKILALRGLDPGAAISLEQGSKTPFGAMLMSPTVWIVMLCDFANIWGKI